MKKQNLIYLVVGMMFFGAMAISKSNGTSEVQCNVVEQTNPVSYRSAQEQQMFLEMTEGVTHGPFLSFIPDAEIEKCRRMASEGAGCAEELMAKFTELCENVQAYTSQAENNAILAKGSGEDIFAFRMDVKDYVNKKYDKGDEGDEGEH